jgi:alginate O-acetyltransferase complex protein AlgI
VLFHSPVFLFVFLPITLAAYLLFERHAAAGVSIGFLALASLFFYSWWNPLYLPLLVGSIAVNFAVGRLISPDSSLRCRRGLLCFGVIANLCLLGIFKYADFVVRSLDWFGNLRIPELGIVLPLAISFFTFQQIAFLVDSYQGKAPERSFAAYCLFITFFPHLIAGPIVHHREMMPQFASLIAGRRRSPDQIWHDLAVGLAMFTIGLVKKVMFADQFGIWADNAFRAADAGANLSFIEAWLGTASFALQIYLDFSGYSDMALGLARLFGVKLPLNFASPYKATSIIEFWRRWHMTLSRFLRDYLYFPLGGNRRGVVRQQCNIMVVMLLGGLWHGAAWTFVVWGGLHGLFLVINHGYRALTARGFPALGRWPSLLVTMICVLVAWTFFRAETFSGSIAVVRGLAGGNGIALPLHWEPAFGSIVETLARWGLPVGFAPMSAYSGGAQVAWVVLGFAAMWLLPNTQELLRHHNPAFEAVASPGGIAALLQWRPSGLSGLVFATIAVAVSVVVLRGKAGEFIYFQF